MNRLSFARRTFSSFYQYSQPTTNPKVWFQVSEGENVLGKLEFELFEHRVPKTVENFKQLISGQNSISKTYVGTPFHRIIDGFVA